MKGRIALEILVYFSIVENYDLERKIKRPTSLVQRFLLMLSDSSIVRTFDVDINA
jgi:hypothetical protein